MRVIFLDFDGVLNSWPFLEASPGAKCASREQIDPAAVARLNRLIRATCAKVVVSSSWRMGRNILQLQEILVSRGFEGEVIDKTMDWSDPHAPAYVNGTMRGDEIRLWLKDHPEVSSYVIFDDGADMRGVEDHFIQTSMDTGLLDEHIEAAMFMLRVEEW